MTRGKGINPNHMGLGVKTTKGTGFATRKIINDLEDRYIERVLEAQEIIRTCKEVILLSDGVWQVPIEERPKGWEGMGGREK